MSFEPNMWFSNTNFWGYKLWLSLRRIAHLQRMLCSSLTRMALGSSVPRFTTVSRSHLNLAPMCGLHTSEVVERARQSTRIRKKKINDANKKKKEERLRKNPPPIPKKVGPSSIRCGCLFSQNWSPGAIDADFQRPWKGSKALEETR